ncbi:IclR family transcriptional regulator [Devosia sp. RR2S18]|uniref:IclR family transcriptional regulator n=1 Tax=Devosia rhizosphaerae TaxID=3049774 RepID=UPI002541AEA5|nr:helix-turn-helix domain-containing protein [Devosia sp. RR2S18]WIJ25803.1 helix-turn-helix domain-containing protein [Devosia sp. RR2S18]
METNKTTPGKQGPAVRGKGTDRVLDILDFMARYDGPCTIPEIAAAVRSPKSTTYLLVEQLTGRGYIDRFDSRHFQLGRQAALIGRAAVKRMDFGRFARDATETLARDSNQLAEFVSVDNWRQIVLIAAVGPNPTYLLSAEGSRHPLPRTASSRFLLRDLPEEEILRNVPEQDYVLRDGSRMTPQEFLASIDAARGMDALALRGQVDPHLACLASPVLDGNNRCIATISLVIPLLDFEGRFEEFAALTRQAAKTLTEQLSLTPVGAEGVLGLLLQKYR